MGVLSRTRSYLNYRLRYEYFKVRGYRNISVGDASVRFKVGNFEDFFELEYIDETERPVVADFLDSVNEFESPVIFDVGANIGVYSLLVQQACPGARVVAIEPHPTNAYHLLQNMRLNDAQIDVVQAVISDVEEPVPITGEKDGLVSDGTVAMANSGHVFSNSKTLTNLIEQGCWEIPNIIKIDVEGAEGKVLRGMIPIITEVDVLYYELHLQNPSNIHRFDDDEDSIHGIIDKNEFTREQLTDHGERQIWKATST